MSKRKSMYTHFNMSTVQNQQFDFLMKQAYISRTSFLYRSKFVVRLNRELYNSCGLLRFFLLTQVPDSFPYMSNPQ